MPQGYQALFPTPFLRKRWDADFKVFQESQDSMSLISRLHTWANRLNKKETTDEGALIGLFLKILGIIG